MRFVLAILLSVILLPVWASKATRFKATHDLVLKKDGVQATQSLLQMDDDSLSDEAKALKYFALGRLAADNQNWDDARYYLAASLGLKTRLGAYAHYQLGNVHKNMTQLSQAKVEYQKALSLRPPKNIRYSVRFALSDVAMQQGHWRTANKHLRFLERRWRYTARHPDVLWRLVQVEKKRHRQSRACRWARKLYAKYPSHPLVYDWDVKLEDSPYKGGQLGCRATESDQKKRMRRLQLAGESDRARSEIDTLRLAHEKKEIKTYKEDELLVSFLINEGFVNQALKILLGHYEKQKTNFDYLLVLGKAASRAGEYQTAVGALYGAHKLKPRHRTGRKALFSAAFLSYQFQDYDGANRKFQEFVNKNSRSGLRRNAKWHLAWIRYLKGDYAGAIKGFKRIQREKRRHRRRWKKFPEEKIKYWLAMSHLRMQDYKSARPLFAELAADKLLTFYTMAAQQRLQKLPEPLPGRSITQVQVKNFGDELEGLEAADSGAPQPPNAAVKEEDESEENMQITADDLESTEKNEEEEEEGMSEREERVNATVVLDPRLRKHLDRARDLIAVGFYDWAKLELFEMESRTRNPTYLKLLMSAYESIGEYRRSAYLSDAYFAKQRQRYGITGVRYLWEHAYPQAFKESVTSYSQRFQVPQEFIWSIMRSESYFRKDVVSPVGAKGLMQVMPFTANQVAKLLGESAFHERTLVDPDVNIRIGSRYLSRLMRKFHNQLALAAAGYNAGPHRVDTWVNAFGQLDADEFIEHIPFVETRNYVKKVVRYYGIYNDIYASGKPVSLAWLGQPISFELKEGPTTRESWDDVQ